MLRLLILSRRNKGGDNVNSKYFLAMNHIVKEFNGNTVLKDMNLCVKTGEIVALVGENGAGDRVIIRPS